MKLLHSVQNIFGAALFAIGITLTLVLFASSHPLTAQTSPSQPTFDWTMPDRFGLDANGDGLIDYFTAADAISPTNWTVNVDACANTQSIAEPITEYRWSIAGVDSATSAQCTAELTFSQQGDHEVTLTITTDQGTEASVTQTITVKDWLIVSMGDSYAAGEGAPDKNATLLSPSATWQNAQYHRSAFAAPAVAARLLEEGDAKSSVTFVHLARSRARIIHEDPNRADLNMAAQITEAVTLLGTREIDALLLSIGGNDAGASNIVQTCMAMEPCNADEFSVNDDSLSEEICSIVEDAFGPIPGVGALCRQRADVEVDEIRVFTEDWTKNAATLFGELTAPIPDRFDQLAADFAVLNVQTDSIYITEYPAPTRQDSGALCSPNDGERSLPGISDAEYQWVDQTVLPQMNSLVQGAAERNNWQFIGGISSEFSTHGYCANNNWIVRFPQSVAAQVDLEGTLHPNRAGYEFTGGVIAAQLEVDLMGAGSSVYLPTAFK